MKHRFEQLESRRCMNAAWQNPVNRMDVDDSALVEPLDALQVINRLNLSQDHQLPPDRTDGESFYDTNGDGRVSAIDALLVINVLNRYSDPLHLIVNASPDADRNANGVVLAPEVSFTGSTLPNVRVIASRT